MNAGTTASAENEMIAEPCFLFHPLDIAAHSTNSE
jgi:hypothetical protein